MRITTDMLSTIAAAGRAATSLLAADVPVLREPALLLATASSELPEILDALSKGEESAASGDGFVLGTALGKADTCRGLADRAARMIQDALPSLWAGVKYREHKLIEDAVNAADRLKKLSGQLLERAEHGAGLEPLENAIIALGALEASQTARRIRRRIHGTTDLSISDVLQALNKVLDDIEVDDRIDADERAEAAR